MILFTHRAHIHAVSPHKKLIHTLCIVMYVCDERGICDDHCIRTQIPTDIHTICTSMHVRIWRKHPSLEVRHCDRSATGRACKLEHIWICICNEIDRKPDKRFSPVCLSYVYMSSARHKYKHVTFVCRRGPSRSTSAIELVQIVPSPAARATEAAAESKIR